MKIELDFFDLTYLQFLLIKTIERCNDDLKSLKECKKYFELDDCIGDYQDDIQELEFYIKIYSNILHDIKKQSDN